MIVASAMVPKPIPKKNGSKKSFSDLNGVPGFVGAIEENVDVRCHELIVRVLHIPADKFDG